MPSPAVDDSCEPPSATQLKFQVRVLRVEGSWSMRVEFFDAVTDGIELGRTDLRRTVPLCWPLGVGTYPTAPTPTIGIRGAVRRRWVC